MIEQGSSPEPTEAAVALYRATWGDEPLALASAPGRVNLIGEHTDYNDGFVLPMAIDRRTAVALGPSGGRSPHDGPGLGLVSAGHVGIVHIDGPPWTPRGDGSWANYPAGVIAGVERIRKDAGGDRIPPLRIAVASNVPIGAGLSSSAALEAATATGVLGLVGMDLPRKDVALVCQRAEHEFAGVHCGIMDQMASVMGDIILLDCRSLDVRNVALPDGVSVVILDSGIPRGLTSSAYNERRAQCERGVELIRAHGTDAHAHEVRALRDVTPDMLAGAAACLPETIYRRCRHVVTEDARVIEAADALARRDLGTVGMLLGESHASMRDDYEISLPEIDFLVACAAATPGCYGARLTGAGFGGAVIALVDADQAAVIASDVINRYCARTSRPGSALLVAADEGARVHPIAGG